MNNIWILAQTEADQPISRITSEQATEETETTTVVSDSNTPVVKQQPKPFGSYLWIYIVFMVLIMFLFLRGPRKQKQQQKKMLQSLQKNDRVRTIGGIIGTIVDIRDDEITLKVDESNNTKIKVAASAIGRNLSKDK